MARVIGVDLEVYQKLELGEIKPKLGMLNRISDFFGVDPTDLIYESLNVESEEKNGEKQDKSTTNENKTKENCKTAEVNKKQTFALSKGWVITMLVVSVIVLAMYFFVPFYHAEFTYFVGGSTYTKIYNFSLFTSLISSPVHFDAILILLLNVWMLVQSIVMLCSPDLRTGKFAKVCSIVNIVIYLLYILEMTYLCVGIGYTAHVAAWFVVYAIGMIVSILILISPKNRGAKEINYSKFAKIAKCLAIFVSVIYSIYLLAAPICNDFSRRFRLFEYTSNQHGYSTITIILLTLCILFVTINSLIMLSKKALNGKYCFVGNIIAMIFSLIPVIFIAVFSSNGGLSPYYWATIPLCVLVVAATILEIVSVQKAKKQNQI